MIKHKELPEETDLWIKLRTILRQLPHKEQVQFALMCAEEANPELSEAKECIRLVKSWLKDPTSVTNEELRQAADAAYSAAANTTASFSANAAYAAYYAAWSSAASVAYAHWSASAAYACSLK